MLASGQRFGVMGKVRSRHLRVMTLNMHKGRSPLQIRSTIQRLRQKIREHDADLIFIQELQQESARHSRRRAIGASPGLTQYLAEGYWPEWHYGRNAVQLRSHHGNAILSQHPLRRGENYDISAYKFERRGLLHSVIQVRDGHGKAHPVHCFCVHLALFERGRARQLASITAFIDELAGQAPAIVAGDFNDWRNRVGSAMKARGFQEVFETMTGSPARTFPSLQPMLPMDRIYVRGMRVHSAHTLTDWAHLSDHLGLTADIELLGTDPQDSSAS